MQRKELPKPGRTIPEASRDRLVQEWAERWKKAPSGVADIAAILKKELTTTEKKKERKAKHAKKARDAAKAKRPEEKKKKTKPQEADKHWGGEIKAEPKPAELAKKQKRKARPDLREKEPLLDTSDIQACVALAWRELDTEPTSEADPALEKEIRFQLLKKSLANLHRRKYEQMVNIFYLRFPNLSLAEIEEAVQEACARVFDFYLRQPHAPTTYEDLQAIVHAATRNRIFDVLRERKRRGEVPFDPDDWLHYKGECALANLKVDPDQEIEVKSLLKRALARLEKKQGDLVKMVMHGFTGREIAVLLGTKQADRARWWALEKLCRALAILAKEGDSLAEWLHERGCEGPESSSSPAETSG